MSTPTTPHLNRLAPEPQPLEFWGLRSRALTHVQGLSGKRWTDFNLHDPGVTLMEQACYALSSLVYRVDHPVADHLCGPNGRIDLAALALHRPQDALPSRPTTAADYRLMLLNALPELAEARVEPLTGDTVGGFRGIWRVAAQPLRGEAGPDAAVEVRNRALGLREQLASRIGQELRAVRNLGEDFPARGLLSRSRPCSLVGSIEFDESAPPTDTLAAVLMAVERAVLGMVPLRRAGARSAQGTNPDGIYLGPSPALWADEPADNRLKWSGLQAAVRAVPGVRGASGLRLEVHAERAPSETESEGVERHSPETMLRLRLPWRTPTSGGEGLVLHRGAQPWTPDSQRLRMAIEDQRARWLGEHRNPPPHIEPTPPTGHWRAPLDPILMQDGLPAVYAVNHWGVTPHASEAERNQAWQLKTYLLLMDQFIAHSHAQVSAIRDLYTIAPGASPTYQWRMIDDGDLVGARAHAYLGPPEAIEQKVFAQLDQAVRRRSEALEHVLALHGERLECERLRHFTGGRLPSEQALQFLRAQIAMAKDLPLLGRDRCAGVDDSRPAWDTEANVSGLQRRVGRALALDSVASRGLATHWIGERAGATALPRAAMPSAVYRLPVGPIKTDQAERGHERVVRMDARECAAATASDAYFAEADAAGRVRVWLRLNETQAVAVGSAAHRDGALGLATSVRDAALRCADASEGLLVIEHLLLRPLGSDGDGIVRPQSAAHRSLYDEGIDAWALCFKGISVLWPSWPARFAQPGFTQLAEGLVRAHAPAHVAVTNHWLEPQALAQAETLLQTWLAQRERHWASPEDPAQRTRVNHAAAALLRCLSKLPNAAEVPP